MENKRYRTYFTLYFLVFCSILGLLCSSVYSLPGYIKVFESSTSSLEVSRALTQAKQTAWTQFVNRHTGHWTVTVDDKGHMTKASVRRGEYLAAVDKQSIIAWLQSDTEILGVDHSVLQSLRLMETKDTPGGTYYTLQSYHKDIEIFESTLTVKIGENNALLGLINNLQPLCQPDNGETFDRVKAISSIKQDKSGQFLGEKGTVIFHTNGTCQIVVKCFVTSPMPGYRNPVEMFCLVNEKGQILFRKPLSYPYRLDH